MDKEKLSPVKRVKIWMIQKDIRAKALADDYGCSQVFICNFIQGKETSKKMAQYLIDKGCPEENFKNGRLAA